MQLETTQAVHAGPVDALVAYMSDCGFTASNLTAFTLSLALEYVYQPHPRFWRDFDLAYLVRAITLCTPDWRAPLNRANRPAESADKMLTDVGDYLRVNAFDEANAEMMLTLPVHARPSDAACAFDWISAQLASKGLNTELEFAKRDRDACGSHALEVLHCLEEAAQGRTVDRTGTLVARVYRDSVMDRRAPF
ncbi:TPA: hypothetical protein QDB28_001992 [Burkholderia vietnamiensis]|nr:hypothetical protein [Burkholderia vietnamiensis]